jgi:preprotein translocase subunit SecG
MGVVIGFIILFCILLVLVVLAQNAKGGGLSSQFGGSSASNIIGVKKTGDLLEKLTWSFIVVIFALTLSTTLLDKNTGTNNNNVLDDAAKQATPTTEQPVTNPLGQPVDPADTAQ